MAEKNELMTIKAFAAASGRSQQAIYKQISTRLSAYLHEIDGQKFIERRALFEVFHIGEEVEQCNFNSTQPKKASSDKTLELLERTIQMLEEQLQLKDREIERLTETIQTQASGINGAQALHAGTMQQLLPEGEPVESADEVIELVQNEEGQKPTQEPSKPVPNEVELLEGFLREANETIDLLRKEKAQKQEEVVRNLSLWEIFRMKSKKGKTHE